MSYQLLKEILDILPEKLHKDGREYSILIWKKGGDWTISYQTKSNRIREYMFGPDLQLVAERMHSHILKFYKNGHYVKPQED